MFQIGSLLGKLEKIRAIQPQRLDGRATPHRRVPRSSFRQRGFAKIVARLRRTRGRFRRRFGKLDGAGTAGNQNVKCISRIALLDEEIPEFVLLSPPTTPAVFRNARRRKLEDRGTPQRSSSSAFIC